ncbi:MAG: hypothetical protein AB1899_11960 [Pseudomonadota bacterium]
MKVRQGISYECFFVVKPLDIAPLNPEQGVLSFLGVQFHRLRHCIRGRLEAFAGRGNNDYLFSHDLGDVLAVVDSRDSLMAECRLSSAELRRYLEERFAGLLAVPAFIEALPGHLPGDAASQ